ncbi:integrase core domain-containing protein [Sphingobacterium siyangense]|nr:integrase core domain-containing protein [Sphingobacterium siyangense]
MLKNEFYPKRVYQNHKDAAKSIDKIIKVYNLQRPHSSLDFQTPHKCTVSSVYGFTRS